MLIFWYLGAELHTERWARATGIHEFKLLIFELIITVGSYVNIDKV